MDVKDFACPSCEARTLELISHSLTVEHQGKQIRVEGLEGCLCQTCGADPVLMPQIRSNQNKIADAKRVSAGLLKGSQIKSIREALALSQSQAAEHFGGGANAFSKYERGEVIQSAQMDKLLRATLKHPDLLLDLKTGFESSLSWLQQATATGAVTVHSAISYGLVNSISGATLQNNSLIVHVPNESDPGWMKTDFNASNDETYLLAVG